MTMRTYLSHCSLLLALVLMTLPLVAQSPNPRPSGTPHLGRQNDLITMAQNSAREKTTDYGRCIDEARQMAIAGTLRNYDFRLSVAVMILAGIFVICIAWLQRERRQIIDSTGRLVAIYQNQLATGQKSYRELHTKFTQFISEFEREKEPRMPTRFTPARDDAKDPGADVKSKPGSAPAQPVSQTPDSSDGTNQTPSMAETMASLRAQLSAVTQQLEQERGRNRKLRGE